MTKTILFSEKKQPLLTIFEIIEWGSLECRVRVIMHDHLLGVVTGQKYFTFLSATSVVKLFFPPSLLSCQSKTLLGNRFIRIFNLELPHYGRNFKILSKKYPSIFSS